MATLLVLNDLPNASTISTTLLSSCKRGYDIYPNGKISEPERQQVPKHITWAAYNLNRPELEAD